MRIAVRFRVMVLLLLSISLLGCWHWQQEQHQPIYGQVELQDIRIAAKVPGRVEAVMVKPGQMVEAGDLLFRIHSPELNAKLAQAEAARDAAFAVSQRTESGARQEEIEMARLEYHRAQTQAQLLATTHERMRSLHEEGLISRQQYDEIQAQRQAALDQQAQARARWQLANSGAHDQERAASQAQARQATAALAEVEALLADIEQRAPRSAQVADVILQPGELAPAGLPVVTLLLPEEQWAMFTLREDQLPNFAIGQQFSAYVPAIEDELQFVVSRWQALPDFATWRQGRDLSMHLRSFQVEARPVNPDPRLQPGMTLVVL